MEVSDVRVRLVKDANERLKAVCSVTLDNEFVVRDVKVVEGTNGLFVAMPSRKLTSACPKCRTQNHLRARHCNECGGKLPQARIPTDADGREKVHRDIAHPITAAFRQTVQQHVLDAFHDAVEDEGVDGPEEVEVEAVGEDVGSEYDSIIADLRSGGRFEDRKDKGRSDSDRDRDRPRRQRRRRGSHEGRSEEPVRESNERERASTEEKDAAAERADDEPAESEFGAELEVSESHDERERDTVGAPVPRSMERPSGSFGDGGSDADSKGTDEQEEGETSFGEGIL